MKKTILDLLKPFIGEREIYNYSVIGPMSLDDTCEVSVKISYDKYNRPEHYIIDFSPTLEFPKVRAVSR
jgi:hypothetical protein